MGRLTEGQIFTLKVKELHENFDSYPSNSGAGQMHCHKFIMLDELGEEFLCQWCNDATQVTEYKVGDIIQFQTKTFKKGIHNIVPLKKIEYEKPVPQEISMRQPIQGTFVKQGDAIAAHPNPQIAGTMIDRAMTNAVLYYKDNEIPFQNVTKLADEILAWYKQNLNPNN